jgi:hypothetical protein
MDNIVVGGLYTLRHSYNATDPLNGRVVKVIGFANAPWNDVHAVETVTDDADAIKCLCLETELVPVA